ncbi:GntR family transcriptional regulator [Kineococcus sp. SYSU DK003]|uniref:GntR family transcriptional regulator n=1 Tax=Kineococcus sp. SYSU DK003 TaxID=3383124 RepID=UPI003D7E0274
MPGTPTPGGPLSALGAVDRTTRREQILVKLRDAVSTGALAPGTHLAEIELSESLGVSRGTLREALRHLQQEGLLVSDTRGRLNVRVLTEREVREVFAVRSALEALACEVVCAREDRADVVRALRRQLELMADETSLPEMVNRDLEFHAMLCRASGNETLLQSWLHVSGLARAVITAAGVDAALANMAAQRHAPVVDLLERGDAEGVRRFLRSHMAEAAEQIVTRLGEHAQA